MSDESYISIQGWMISRLGLEKVELFSYAIIYGFSQDGESEYKGGSSYIQKWYGCSRPTVEKALKSLLAKGMITKRKEVVSRVTFNRFKANPRYFRGSKETLHGVKKLGGGSKETLHGGSKETLHSNSIISNIKGNLVENAEKISKKFTGVGIKEVAQFMYDYMKGRDAFESYKFPAYWAKYMAEEYVEHFEGNGWKSGSTKLKSFNRTAQRWVRTEEKRGSLKRIPPNHSDYGVNPWDKQPQKGVVPDDYVSPLAR